MMQEFVNFVHKLFPSIDPYVKEQVDIALRQFKIKKREDQVQLKENKSKLSTEKERSYSFFIKGPFDYLRQGDIIGDNLPFVTYSPEGNESIRKTLGFLISNTCDCENDDNITLSPLIPIDQMGFKDLTPIQNNTTYRFLYFPNSDFSDYVVDFSIMNSFPKKAIEDRLKQSKLTRHAYLNKLGYYLFLTKLTVHLMRPEDKDTQQERNTEEM